MLCSFSPRPLRSRPGPGPASASNILSYYRLIGVAAAIGRHPAFGVANMPMVALLRCATICAWIWIGLARSAGAVGAVDLNNLLDQKNLTPEILVRGFADFAFELCPQVQKPEVFLQRKRGDCADFSNLASTVLTHHGYTTKLVVVMMDEQTHVVCYVKEAGGFLDYNHRTDLHPIIPSDGSLEDIAGKVAGDFRSRWRMASAFRYRSGLPEYLDMVFPAAPSAGPVVPEHLSINRAKHATNTAAPGAEATAPLAEVRATVH